MNQDFSLFEQRLIESGYDSEVIEQILEVAQNSIYPKKYGLVWEEKEEKIKEELKLKIPYLEEIKEREINLSEPNSPQHLLIEGDNYEALKLLQTTHRGKVDIIYIDPPYNTGNNDFIYNDRIIDKEDAYRHSKWLSFMHKRLVLAKELMSEDSVIFVSIDDNEFAQLKLLCDEIFGDQNFITNFIWKKKDAPNNTSKFVGDLTEYILVYAKNKNNLEFNLVSLNEKQIKDYKKTDENGRHYKETSILKSNKGSYYRPTLHYGVEVEYNGKSITIYPTEGNRWVYSKQKMLKLLNDGILFVKENNKKEISIYKKHYLDKKEGVLPLNLLDFNTMKNTVATTLLKDMKINFNNPKPVELIKFLIKLHKYDNQKQIIILDFFGGSGTTGHAVLDLNQEDGGNRQFILCTNNENNICEEVTYERLKRVINGYTTPKGKEVEGLPANLKYLKVSYLDKEEQGTIE